MNWRSEIEVLNFNISNKVYAGSKLCGSIVYKADQVVYPVDCPAGTKASEVMVKLASGILTLCEVEVLCKFCL